MIYIFDGTYVGLMTAIFEAFERKEFSTVLSTPAYFQPSFFDHSRPIISDPIKADRVLKGFAKIISKDEVNSIWKAFLSEDLDVINAIFRISIQVFGGNSDVFKNYGDQDVLLFTQTLQKVNRERHRMKAFVRFQQSNDGLFVATVEPDFNVLPLIASFFKNRYSDQAWLIYDKKRDYGIYYDQRSITEVTLSEYHANALALTKDNVHINERDAIYEQLWQSYFKSTNIEARRNMKLHLRHVPKRYWKYLPEKMDALR